MSEQQQQQQQQQRQQCNGATFNNTSSTLDNNISFILPDLSDGSTVPANDLLGLLFQNANSNLRNADSPVCFTVPTNNTASIFTRQQQQPQQPQPQHSSPSEEDEEEVSEQVLKQLPMKERRQIRNKISARNFRNRRKEYMTKLEGEIEQYKLQNSRLSVEVQWLKEMMQKMQQENDRLRLELLLCKNGIPIDAIDTNTWNSTLNTTITGGNTNKNNSNTSGNSNYNSIPPKNSNANTDCPAAGTATLPIPLTTTPSSLPPSTYLTNNKETTANVEAMTTATTTQINTTVSPSQLLEDFFSSSNSSSSSPEDQNLYLSHATVPEWDFSDVLTKNQEQTKFAKSIFEEKKAGTTITTSMTAMQMYPLLAPAIMSIVLHHILVTMMMTSTVVQQNNKAVNQHDDTEKEQNMNNNSNEQSLAMSRVAKGHEDKGCPLAWLRKHLCKFILVCLLAKYPKLNRAVRTYLPVCREYRIQI